MKKVFLTFCVLAVALMFSGCSAFPPYTERYEAEGDEETGVYEASLLVHFESAADALNAPIRTQIESIAGTTAANGVIIEKAELKEYEQDESAEYLAEDTGTVMQLNLVLKNVPKRKIAIKTDMFYRTGITTMFNAISVLPDADTLGVTYSIGIESERRFTDAGGAVWTRTVTGSYVYMWSSPADIVLTQVFPNTPIYYVIAIFAAAAVGAIVYFVCKKTAKPI